MFEKVKECVEHYKSQGNFTYDQQKFLSALAAEYLQVSGRMPEERVCVCNNRRTQLLRICECEAAGYNFARHSCILAIMRMISEQEILKAIPDIHEAIEEYEMRGDNGDYIPNKQEKFLMEDFAIGFVEEIAKAIHTLLTTKLGGKG